MNLLLENQTVKTLFKSIPGVKPTVFSRRSRIANIERLRILSAFGVVSFHTHEWFPNSFCFVGLIILTLCFCVFVVNKHEAYGLAGLAKRKAQRLLVPWVFWSVVYGVLGFAKMIIKNMSFSDVFSAKMLLIGTRGHLWFLPFVFVAVILLGFVHRRIVKVPERFVIVPAILIGTLAVLACSIIRSYWRLWMPLAQWALGLPAIPLGLALGRIMLVQDARHRRNLYLMTVLSTVTVAIAFAMLAWLDRGTYIKFGFIFAMRYCISMAIVCSALHWQGKSDPVSANLASLSYGIYLVHPLVLVPFYQFSIAIERPLLLLFLVLSISSLITFILKKTPLKQFV